MIPSPPPLPAWRKISRTLLCIVAPVDEASVHLVDLGAEEIDFLSRSHFESRLVARFGEERLHRALGGEVADALVAAHATTRAMQLYFSSLARQVAEIASARGIPVMYMKGMALLLGGHVEPGQRYFNDVDLLAPEEQADELWEALVEKGFRPSGVELSHGHQHLQSLTPRLGGGLEIHRWLSGVGAGRGDGVARLDELIGAGACCAAQGFPVGTWLPRSDLLAANLVAHTFDTHRLGAWAGYFGLRLLADLVDLRPLLKATDREVTAWLEGATDLGLVDAAEEIVECCTGGGDPGELLRDRRSDGGRLLAHWIALEVDTDYREVVNMRRATNGFTPTGWWHTLYRPWSELRARFGSRGAVMGWYLHRTFHLAAMVAKTVVAWLKVRHRNRSAASVRSNQARRR